MFQSYIRIAKDVAERELPVQNEIGTQSIQLFSFFQNYVNIIGKRRWTDLLRSSLHNLKT